MGAAEIDGVHSFAPVVGEPGKFPEPKLGKHIQVGGVGMPGSGEDIMGGEQRDHLFIKKLTMVRKFVKAIL